MYPFFHFFGRPIPAYGLMAICGIGVCIGAIALLCKLRGKSRIDTKFTDILLAGCVALGCAMIGAMILRPIMKLPDVIINWERYSQVPAGLLLRHIFGELVFYGGLIGGTLGAGIFCLKCKIPLIPTFDILAPAVALGHAFGRFGCFLGGCCYGIEVSHSHPFAVVYPPESLLAPPGIPLLPIPLIESACIIIISAIAAVVYLKVNKPGLCTGLYFALYAILRFTIEFFRGDLVRGLYWGLSTSQYISTGIFAVGIMFVLYAFRKPKKKQEDLSET